MEKFLFFNVIVSALNVFIIVYAYSLNFFPKKWRKKVNQDTAVGMALIFSTMFTIFISSAVALMLVVPSLINKSRKMSSEIPFGPYIIVGCILYVAFANQIKYFLF